MEAIADLPASEQHVPFINPSNARELAQKRWQMQREREERERNAPAPAIVAAIPDAVQADRASAIERKVKQMAKFDDMIDEETDAKELHMLTASRERIFREWCALTRNPISGTFKAMPEKQTRQRPAMVEPS